MLELISKAAAVDITGAKITMLGSGSLGQIINRVVGWVLILAGVIAVIYLIYGGLLYITAAGDAEKATKGRTALINAIIGIIIIALAYLIVVWVNNVIQRGQT